MKTVAILITAIGVGFLTETIQKKFYSDYLIIALPVAIGLAAIDCYYVYKEVIAKIYLLDAAAQVLFVMVFVLSLWRKSRIK
jgi:hypothetical protein